MTVGACQQMIKGVSGRCHSLCCITNRLFSSPLIPLLCHSVEEWDVKGAKIVIKNEIRSVYIKGDTASVESSGLGFGRFNFILVLCYLDRVCKGLRALGTGLTRSNKTLFSLNLSIIFF